MSNAPDPASSAIAFVLQHEGGLVDHPADPGGLTNFGISQRAYPHLDVRALTREQAADIYRRDYWDRLRLDELPGPVALAVMDAAVNSGPDRSARLLQEAVNLFAPGLLAVDGSLGPKTRAAVGQLDAVEVALAAIALRGLFLLGLKTASTFGRGWASRCRALMAEAVRLAYADQSGRWK